MTPQSSFVVVAPVIEDRVSGLRALLSSMNDRPGMARRDNSIVPFGDFENLHYARFVILDDQTLHDFEEYGAPIPDFAVLLAFMGDCDGPADKLLADIAALRSRVAAVTTTLFSSKLRVVVELDGDDARVQSFKITLDDGIVYAAPDRFTAGDPQVVYEHAVASGHHVVGVEIERYDARNREYRTFQTSKFSIVVPESKRLETSFTVEDDSDMADDFPSDQDGEYDLHVRLRAQVID